MIFNTLGEENKKNYYGVLVNLEKVTKLEVRD